jgi:hypothetical protein
MIVSRDNDYGITIGEEGILNDWLKKEFKERVSRKRKILLTQKLTVALKKLDEIVRPEDEREEEKVIEKNPYLATSNLEWPALDAEMVKRILQSMRTDVRAIRLQDRPSSPSEDPDT